MLAEAIPALMEAEAALNSIKRDDITEIRSFAKPHILVQQARQTLIAPALLLAYGQPNSCQDRGCRVCMAPAGLSITTACLPRFMPFTLPHDKGT